MKPLQIRYSLTKFKKPGKPVSIDSFVIREVSGDDEELAAQNAKAKGPGTTLMEELVRLALVEVDGKPVEQPYGDYDHWNSRTRTFVTNAFRALNAVDPAELPDFFEAGEPLP